ncbi:MAG: hypothetical protein ACJ72R_17005 [Nitrososphaeraceae archaeon]
MPSNSYHCPSSSTAFCIGYASGFSKGWHEANDAIIVYAKNSQYSTLF